MYVQFYRSKVQFYCKRGGEARACRLKRLVRLAYWPRLTGGALLSGDGGAARQSRRLVAELEAM